MEPINLWHLYARLVALGAIMGELDNDVWNSDDALERTRAYLEELASVCEVALDYIKELKQHGHQSSLAEPRQPSGDTEEMTQEE